MNYRTTLSLAVGFLTLSLGALFAVVLEADHVANTGDATWLPYVAESPALTVIFYDNVVMVAGFVLSPLLVFAVGFVVGRRLDLTREYRGVLGALLAGSVVGYALGRLAAVLLAFGFGVSVPALVGLVFPALVVGSARAVLAGFAGAALGFLVSRRSRREATETADPVGTRPAP